MWCIHTVVLTQPLLGRNLSDRSDFHRINSLSIAVHAFTRRILTSLSGDDISQFLSSFHSFFLCRHVFLSMYAYNTVCFCIYIYIYNFLYIYIYTRITKAWTAIDRLSIIWKSDLTDKKKCSFFQAAVVSILLYGCTTWTLTKRLKKKLDGNYTRMLRAILNKSWRQHPTRHQLYGHLPPITKIIQVRRTRHAGHCWKSKDELISDVLLWTPHMAKQKQDDQLGHT